MKQNKFKKVLDTPLVRVLSKKGQAVPLFQEADLMPSEPTAEAEKEKDETQAESDFFSGLFVETNTVLAPTA